MKLQINRMAKLAGVMLAGAVLFAARPALAYHPMDTDDPGTTGFRQFELEWGSDMLWPEGQSMDEASGYIAVKSGLAEGLEMDTVVNYTYLLNDYEENKKRISGFGDAELLFKWRFYGDGDGPNNMGLEFLTVLPSGEEDKGLRGGDDPIPTAFLIGSVGQGNLRLIINAGAIFVPEANDLMLYGAGLEWSDSDKLRLVADLYGEADLEASGDDNLLESVAGATYGLTDSLTLGVGVALGLTEASPDSRFTFSALFGW